MTNPGYEELEARLGPLADKWEAIGEKHPAYLDRGLYAALRESVVGLADLRKQRDEAERLIEVGASNLYTIQSENERLAIENATLRAENERLTQVNDRLARERDELLQHCTIRDLQIEAAEAEAERLRKVAEGEREAIAEEARRYAGFYSEGSDGRNTFILLAEWIERRSNLSSKED